ncbi:glycosyltransferase family 4 protein [Clostridium saccharobutylicum]|uniref:Glycogen synthase n=1 Tax=Clostridium saccharobutylicum TaxID=169679 RepID=A0A1S8NJD1_CLOSA|nr:glycosyltransferase family 4 protein [Clostridium saccharobutylicum]OOM16547.1 glycogen synthase [Clostridium saccharobutylicum]
MKILLVTSYYYPNMFGGTEHSVKLLAEGLKKNGHEVYVISADRKDKEIEDINGIKVIRFNLKFKSDLILWKIVRKGFEFRNYMIKNRLMRFIEEIRPDVIHTNNLFYLSPIVWKVGSEKGIKIIHTLRDYWGICPKCTLLNSKNEICSKRKFLCKLHQFNYESYAKYVDIVTAPSSFTLNKYGEYNIFKKSKNVMIANAIDLNFNEHQKIMEKKLNKSFNKVKFLFMGTMVKFKGIEYLIRNFKEINNPNIELTICGEGKMQSYIQEIIKDDPRIKYLGRVDSVQKEKVLLENDVMIVPSIWYEPFGRVIIEAYKYALPVIACNIGGITELLDAGAAIGVQPNSDAELKESIDKLSNVDELKNYIKGTKKPLYNYEISDQIKKFEEIYT